MKERFFAGIIIIEGGHMAQFADPNENRFLILEHMATEIRKFLLGSLIFSKVIWKNELAQKPKGIEILKMIEEAEEAFLNDSLTSKFDRLEDVLSLIHKRAKGLFLLMEYIAKSKRD
jgi:hypothetical protein